MSSRIEKGGARFKPSIVPRKSTGGAATSGGTPVTASPQAALPTQQPTPSSSSGPPPSPSLTPVVTARHSRPPSVRSKDSAVAPTAIPPSVSQPSATQAGSSKSYAFNVSPSIINKPGASTTTRTSVTAGQTSSSASKAKPVFRRPSVSKPRPGSRASLTPAPNFAHPPAPASQPLQPLSEHATRTDIPPSVGGAASDTVSEVAPARADATRVPLQTDLIIDKASQPDPLQVPLRSSRSRGASTTQAEVTTAIKESASQQETAPSSRSQRRAAVTAAAPSAPLTELNGTANPVSSSRKGKAREISQTSKAGDGLASAQGVKAGSQAAGTAALATDAEKAASAAQRRLDAAARLQKRRLKRKELSSGKPRRPLSAYLLFVNSVRSQRQTQNPDMPLTELTAEIAAEWRELEPAQRTKWEAEASLLRQQYDTALDAWKLAHPEGVSLGPEDESDMETTSEIDEDGEPIRRKKRRITASRKPHTVSDDEEEYRKQVFHEGEQLASSRIDPENITMADISTADYRKGRAGPRTFEADRVYKRLVHDRRAAAKSALLGEHVLGEKVNHASPSPAPAANIIRTANGVPVATGAEEALQGEEEVVGEQTGEEDEDKDETDADGTTDGEGVSSSRRARRRREPSVAATEVSFRENRFAVQTRIVDGKIVLDETSLFANYGNGEEDRDNMEVVDEREGDRFVNASTYSRKLGRNKKWSADETAKFYRCLQQWGTDFEMIARLFPGRDRVMIKKKFNVEEKSNAKLVDEALTNSVPVNLEAYAQAIGVDLSGPPPEIKADLHDIESLAAAAAATAVDVAVKKREGTATASSRKGDRSDAEQDDGDDGYEYEEVVEIDDDGNEQVIRRRLGKKPGRKGSKKKRNSTRTHSTSTPAPSAPEPASEPVASAIGTHSAAIDATEANPSTGAKARSTKSSGPPSIGSRKSTRATRKRAASINSSKEAPGDGREVEEIVGEL
ncbi:hypothetical protein PHSY_007189 [Pseudozyma hubeiensis SY62]|uniref:HMG box domain-containing protein n=1 Tax=Pseudozyma hubeiensis (strain SY62) TaxID=1305764 RepID=R9PE03_PSEHS|nr:hypothetical protein PHSY_007189 [Pseudozyma hubeiensis SY62]GAC99586.1 hypothetical protein PHSY_007189 [Pseudozyma hubeiensis SY62]